MGARILLNGQARHAPSVRCVGPCARGLVPIARWVVDAIVAVDGEPLGGHLCPVCDPWTPRNQRAAQSEPDLRRNGL